MSEPTDEEERTAAQEWAFIFNEFGKEKLRKLLLRAAQQKNADGRVIIEFDGDRAMDVTDHVAELEDQL